MATLAKYNKFLQKQMNGEAVDFDTNTIKVSLHTATYTPSPTTHTYFSDVTNEVTGTNYTAGGNTLGTLSLTESAGTVTFDAADTTWTANAAGFSNARYAVLYKSTGTASTSVLIGYIDFGSDKGNVGGDLTIQWNASGIISWQ